MTEFEGCIDPDDVFVSLQNINFKKLQFIEFRFHHIGNSAIGVMDGVHSQRMALIVVSVVGCSYDLPSKFCTLFFHVSETEKVHVVVSWCWKEVVIIAKDCCDHSHCLVHYL